jgi:hypothetical protein
MTVAAIAGLGLACWAFAAPASAPSAGAAGKAAAPQPAAKAAPANAEAAKPPADSGDGIQGEYAGTFTRPAGIPLKADAKIVAEGGGSYKVILIWSEEGKTNRMWWSARTEGNKVLMDGKSETTEMSGSIADKKLTAEIKGSASGKFSLTYALRHSPTEGDAPPPGAVVLLPYAEGKATSTAEWTNATWKTLTDGSMIVGKDNNSSKISFGDCRVHVEFYIPFEADKRGQDRGNSGVYLESRYEIQILDSFGLEAKNNECGAIYGVAAPRTNACYPPGQWQTFDIVFRAPRVDRDKVLRPAVITVRHNGVKIHDIVKVSTTTTAGVAGPPAETAPLMLQDHGHAVRFRNIWVLPLTEDQPGGL